MDDSHRNGFQQVTAPALKSNWFWMHVRSCPAGISDSVCNTLPSRSYQYGILFSPLLRNGHNPIRLLEKEIGNYFTEILKLCRKKRFLTTFISFGARFSDMKHEKESSVTVRKLYCPYKGCDIGNMHYNDILPLTYIKPLVLNYNKLCMEYF